jgi:hypothetical protein
MVEIAREEIIPRDLVPFAVKHRDVRVIVGDELSRALNRPLKGRKFFDRWLRAVCNLIPHRQSLPG